MEENLTLIYVLHPFRSQLTLEIILHPEKSLLRTHPLGENLEEISSQEKDVGVNSISDI